MTPEVVEHVFEPFFTTKPRGHGTGLGLATVYGIVEESGGRIEVQSAPDEGTTFRIILPRVEEAPRPREAIEAGLETRRGTETILLAEDQEAVRALAGRFLVALGYTVIAAADGPAALEIARRRMEEIDLVVTDVVMPGMGGSELAARIRALRPGLPVVFLSGYPADVVARSDLAELQGPLVSKPFGRRQLASAVRRALDEPK
jgi:CheY-like chemotaxis protein